MKRGQIRMTELGKEETATGAKSVTQQLHLRLRMHSPVFICIVAFLLRILAIGMVQTRPMDGASPLWKSGLEIVNIASSIASHKGFSSPFGIESGPTAWIPPVYPAIVAAIFMLLGSRSDLAAMTILAMQALFSALTCIPLYAIARRVFDENSAAVAAWGWAFFPYELLIPELFVWETSLSALLLVLACYFSIDLSQNDRWKPVLAGIAWGIAALTSTALISVMPVFLSLPHFFKRRARFPYKTIATVMLVSALLVCPWILRNWHALGAMVPVRSNFGEELWVGNHEGGFGRIVSGLGPADNDAERERYRTMGELSYVTQRRRQAIHFISANPAPFCRRVLYRFRYWWFAEGEHAAAFTFYRLLTLLSFAGVVLALPKSKDPLVLAILASIVIYPLVYYVTDVYPRYRYPLEPFLMLFAGFAISRLFALRKRKIGTAFVS